MLVALVRDADLGSHWSRGWCGPVLLNVGRRGGQWPIFIAMIVERVARDANSQCGLPVRRERIIRLAEQCGLLVRSPLVDGITVNTFDEPFTEGIFDGQSIGGLRQCRQQG